MGRCKSGQGGAWQGTAGKVWLGMARNGQSCFGEVRFGKARHVVVGLGLAGEARWGVAGFGSVGCGLSRQAW